MKRYDIVLLALYVLIVTTSYGFVRYVYHMEQETSREFKTVVDNQDITSIVIKNVYSNLEVFHAKEGDSDNWRLRGSLSQHHLESLYIEGGVLNIESVEDNKLWQLKVNRDIPIEIINSPNVKILSDEELANRVKNKKNRWRYEL